MAGSVTGVLVRKIREVAGDEGVARALAIAGISASAAVLEDQASWCAHEHVVALFQAGIEVTGEAEFPLRCGEETINQYAGTEVTALLRSLGSPGEVLRNVAVTASKFTTVQEMEALEIGGDCAIVAAWASGGVKHRPPASCAYTAGLLSTAPVLFGMDPAEILETECQNRGDDRCVYEVRWDPSSSPDADPQRRVEYLETRLGALSERLDSFQATANEIVATDIDAVLEAVTRRAGLAIRAPRYLLAVSFDRDELRLHHQGFDDEREAGAVAREVLSERPDDCNGSRLIVDVTSRGRRFGRIAALYPQGARFFPAERRLLESYAANAAAALEPAAALDEARRRNRTANALLALASSLAEVSTSEGVARRLAEAVPSVVECTHSAVLLWDPGTEALRYVGMSGYEDDAEAKLRHVAFTRAEVPELDQLLTDPKPVTVRSETASPLLRNVLRVAGAHAATAVPIIASGEFYGLVTADLDYSAARSDTLERLTGMSNQAATALQNAGLLDRIRHQALHDPLTGLPNRTLLADRTNQALRAALRNDTRVGFLFLDLDKFKAVNDGHGHAYGDALLAQIAQRLAGAVRKSDTVARVGGDEFVLLLAGLACADEAEQVATKVLDLLATPCEVRGRQISVSASIGIAIAGPADDYEYLLTQSDAAMYAAKVRGGEQVMIGAS